MKYDDGYYEIGGFSVDGLSRVALNKRSVFQRTEASVFAIVFLLDTGVVVGLNI